MSRTVGVLAATVGAMITAGLWLFPVSFAVLGTDIDCGMPIAAAIAGRNVEADGDINQAVNDECVRRSTTRVIAGAGIGAAGILGGLAGMIVGGQREAGPSQ